MCLCKKETEKKIVNTLERLKSTTTKTNLFTYNLEQILSSNSKTFSLLYFVLPLEWKVMESGI